MTDVPRRSRPPSMKDVAKLAGVSQTTVSFVVNRVDAGIPPETQDRVWEAIAELGYRPNAAARQLRSNRSHTIGFVSDEIVTTPFAGQIIQGAQDAAWANNNLLLVVNTGNDPELSHTAIDMLLERQVDGIIYATMYHRVVEPPESIREVPAVLLDCYVADRSLPSVVPDEVRGGKEATLHLLQKGHRRIGFVTTSTPIPAQVGRMDGYKQALAEFQIPFDDELVRMSDATPTDGYRCALELLRLPARPTALFCFNDRMAMGVYDAIRDLGLAIPDDVAVVGFDNHEIIAAYLRPPLTTMQLPHYEMGQWAVQYLFELMQAPNQSNHAPVQHLVECPLVERASV